MGGGCGKVTASTETKQPSLMAVAPAEQSCFASPPQPFFFFSGLDEGIRRKLEAVVKKCQESPGDLNGIAELAQDLADVARTSSSTSKNKGQKASDTGASVVAKQGLTPKQEAKYVASNTVEAVPLQLSMQSHRLVCSRRQTIITVPLQDVQAERMEWLKAQMGLWDCPVTKMTQDELVVHTENMFEELGLISKFRIGKNKLRMFLLMMRSLYHDENPYHNFTHAVDVVSGIYFFLTHTDARESLDELEVLALFVSAIGHDVDHPGVNQNLEKATKSDIAVLHNFRSILENHHLNTLFQVLKMPQANILDNLSPEDEKQVHESMVENILATDISRHVELTMQITNRVSKSFFPSKNQDDRRVLAMAILKLSDISNPAKPFATAAKWANAVLKEFYNQGDLEKVLGLPVSPLCDRTTGDLPGSQIGFTRFVVAPFFNICCELMDGLQPIVEIIAANLVMWEEKQQQAIAQSKMNSLSDVELLRKGIMWMPNDDLGDKNESELLEILVQSRGSEVHITGDLQEFVELVQWNTSAQSVCLYWNDPYTPGHMRRVAKTGCAIGLEVLEISNVKGLVGQCIREGRTIEAHARASPGGKGRRLSEVCPEYDSDFDGILSTSILYVPVRGPGGDGPIRGIVQLRNKTAREANEKRMYNARSKRTRKHAVTEFSLKACVAVTADDTAKSETGAGVVPQRRDALMELLDTKFTQADSVFVEWALNSGAEALQSFAMQSTMNHQIEGAKTANDETDAKLSMIRIVGVFVEEARKLVDAERASLYLVDQLTCELYTVRTGGSEEGVVVRLPVGTGLAGECAARGGEIIIDDVYQDERFSKEWDLENNFVTRSMLCVPILGSAGDVLGVVQMINKADDGVFRIGDIAMLRQLISKASPVIEKSQMFTAMSALLNNLDVFDAEGNNMDTLMEQIMAAGAALLQADRCTLFLLDQQTNTFWSKIATGDVVITLPAGEGVVGEAATLKRMINISDAYEYPKFNRETDERTGYKTVSIIVAPIINNQGEVIGAIQLLNKMHHGDGSYIPFTESDESILDAFINHVAIALTNSQLLDTTFQNLGHVMNMARAVPDHLLSVGSNKEYVISNAPISTMLSFVPEARKLPPKVTSVKSQVRLLEIKQDWNAEDLPNDWLRRLNVQLDEDVSSVLEGKQAAIHNLTAEIVGTKRPCLGYSVTSIISQRLGSPVCIGALIILKINEAAPTIASEEKA